MDNYKIDPKKQFSKKLARWTAIFWFFYMTWLSVIVYLQPQAALYCVYLAINVTLVMLLNVWAYTRNSIYEKGVFAMLDKAKLSMNLGSYKPDKPSWSSDEDDIVEDDEIIEEEGGGNG